MGDEMKIIVAAIIFTSLSVVSFASDRSSQVRDRYGNLVETKEIHGDDTTVRDRYGNISRTEQREGPQKVIRGRNGNIIGTEEPN
jgi:hypothetical protein